MSLVIPYFLLVRLLYKVGSSISKAWAYRRLLLVFPPFIKDTLRRPPAIPVTLLP